VPWIPALLLLFVLQYGDRLGDWLGVLVRTKVALLGTTLALSLLALPHVAVVGEPEQAYEVFRSDAVCPWGQPERLRGQRWFDCLDHVAWEKPPVVLTALDGYFSASRVGILFLAALVPTILGLLFLARGRLGVGTDGQEVRSANPP
jgi:hypothetical protein